MEIFDEEVERVLFSRSLRLNDDDDIGRSLETFFHDEMRVVYGFFGPEDARNILCQVRPCRQVCCRQVCYVHAEHYNLQAIGYNLTDVLHAWVLPAYTNPNWWRRTSQSFSCTDEEMQEALESVIFVDAVKFPPFVSKLSNSGKGTNLANFYDLNIV